MKKNALLSIVALMLVCLTALSGCKAAGYDFENNDLTPYITLPSDLSTHDFKAGLTLKELPTDEDVQKEIDKVLKELAEPVDLDENATVQDLDDLVMDYVGKYKADGKNSDGTEYKAGDEFSGGKATDSKHTVDLENSTFIDGFDKGLIGMKVGETKDLELKFPDPYTNNPDLAGVEVIFTVTLDKIERTQSPELTDTLVAEHPDKFEDMTTAQAYRDHVKEHLTEDAESANNKKLINAAWKYVLEKSTYTGQYPAGVLDEYIKTYLDYYEHTVAAQKDQHLGEYVKSQGYDSITAFKDAVVVPEAETALKERLALYAVAKFVDIRVTEDDLKAHAQEYYDTNIATNLQLYSAYFGISNFNDYYKSVKDDPSVKEGLMFDRAFEKLLGITGK